MKKPKELKRPWEKSLNIKERFKWATSEQREYILAEIKFQRSQARIEVIEKAIDIFDKLPEDEIMTKNPIILELKVLKEKYE